MTDKVLVTRKIPESGMAMLRQKFSVDCPDPPLSGKHELISRLEGCTALVSLLSDPVDEEVLRSAPRLKIVANYAVGYNNIDIAAGNGLSVSAISISFFHPHSGLPPSRGKGICGC